jgi:hypothetical protein
MISLHARPSALNVGYHKIYIVYVCVRVRTCAYVCVRVRTCAYVCVRVRTCTLYGSHLSVIGLGGKWVST